jgi:hypothetical protein
MQPPVQAVSNDALVAKVEALMRTSNWQAVQEAIDAQGPLSALPFTLRLARAMAQRELEPKPPERAEPSRRPLIAALGLGLALGFLLAWLLFRTRG